MLVIIGPQKNPGTVHLDVEGYDITENPYGSRK